MNKKELFYCYSYQLMLFLKLQKINPKTTFKYKNKNKNCWVYEKNDYLFKALTNWNKYKQSFLIPEKGGSK